MHMTKLEMQATAQSLCCKLNDFNFCNSCFSKGKTGQHC